MHNSIPKACFSVRKTELASLLKQIRVVKSSSRSKLSTCEFTLTDKLVSFVAPGVKLSMPVLTSVGTAKATFELNTFIKLVNTYAIDNITIEIHQGYFLVEKFKVPSSVTFIEDDKILRSIDLPLNYTEFDLLLISRDKRYTQQELDFNKLTRLISETEKKLADIFDNMEKQLKKFGITKKDMQDLIEDKIMKKLNPHRDS